MISFPRIFFIALMSILVALPALAAGRGEGGCIVNKKVAIFSSSKSDKGSGYGEAGDCFSAITTVGLTGIEYAFEEENGRVHISFFTSPDEKGFAPSIGWISSGDIEKFTYECGCGILKEQRDSCSPHTSAGVFSGLTYNACFKEARDKKKVDILKRGDGVPASPSNASADSKVALASTAKVNTGSTQIESALRNEDILSLAKVGLDDKLIISKINTAKATDFDVSTAGLITLKTAKISNEIIAAMMKITNAKK